MEKIKCTPEEGSRLKAMVGNLIDCFPTGRIRCKDMNKYNEELNKVMTELIDENSCKFG